MKTMVGVGEVGGEEVEVEGGGRGSSSQPE